MKQKLYVSNMLETREQSKISAMGGQMYATATSKEEG